MNFREMTDTDVAFVADHSASRGIFHKQPEITDYSYCLEDEGIVLCIGGMRLITPTVAWGWLDLAYYADEHTLTVYRVIKEWMEQMCKDNGIKRLQAYIDPTFLEALRLIRHLGFEYESTMKKFIDDRDAEMFVRFF